MATAQDIVDGAWRKARITNPNTTQQANGLSGLNDLLTSWSEEGLLVYEVTEETFTLVVGTAIYTWGSGGDINTARPVEVKDAFIRDSDNVDYPVIISMSMQEYNDIAVKATGARATRLYYSSEYPLAKIKLDYTPIDAETLYLYSEKHLTEFATLATTYAMPPGYKRALIYNLAMELAPEEDIQLPQEVFAIANQSKKTLERNNIKPVDPVKVDPALLYGTTYEYIITSR